MASLESTLTLRNSVVSHNEALGSGGGIYHVHESVRNIDVRNSIITGNTAVQNGGGLHVETPDYPPLSGLYTLEDTVFSNNSILDDRTASGVGGGGIYLSSALSVEFKRCQVYGNEATHLEGGGLFLGGSALVNAEDLQVYENVANYGAGIYLNYAVLNLERCAFESNTARVCVFGELYS